MFLVILELQPVIEHPMVHSTFFHESDGYNEGDDSDDDDNDDNDDYDNDDDGFPAMMKMMMVKMYFYLVCVVRGGKGNPQ